MPNKKRILFVNEGHHHLTGFGTYGKEILTRLYNMGKYEIAEMAGFTTLKQANSTDCPWKFYATSVDDEDPRYQQFVSNPKNQYGKWRLEKILLDFKPDIVFCIRDYWMDDWISESPLRPYFHWAWMPTVDSSPQNEAWTETFIKADSVLTYSEWALGVLKKEGGGKINLIGTASPGVDLEVFKPFGNKPQHKKNMGLDPNINIVGTVMRNQRRKLYPDLFESFAKFLHNCVDKGREDIAKKTFLYIHSSYPDGAGWKFPYLLKEHGLGHKTYFTYICKRCKKFWPSLFQGARTVCENCKSIDATLPGTQSGLDRPQLASVFNLFDCYVQYSICLTKNQEVLTFNGWKPISQINIGEYVKSHLGNWREVIRVFKILIEII